jgi:hypothetical protein
MPVEFIELQSSSVIEPELIETRQHLDHLIHESKRLR